MVANHVRKDKDEMRSIGFQICPMLEMGSSPHEAKLEAERLMSLMPGGQSCNAKAKAAMPKLPSCNAKAKAVEVDKKNIQAAMPKLPSDGSNPAPVNYNGGVIYTSIKASAFRPLTTRGDKYSEKSCVKWKAQ